MVLVLDEHHGGVFPQEFQGRVQLDALTHGDVRVGHTVEEEDGGVDLVGVKERALAQDHLLGFRLPGVVVRRGHFAVGVAPVAFAPVTGDVGDAGVADCRGEQVRLHHEVLRHEAAEGGADTADAAPVHEGVGLTELFHTLNDVLGPAFAPGIDVPGCEFLSEARRTGRLDDVHDVAAGGIEVVRIAALEVASRRGAAAVVIDNHRVLFRRIEVRRKVVAAVDGLAAAVGIVPVMDLP